jgi:hypothetical protein
MNGCARLWLADELVSCAVEAQAREKIADGRQ